MNEVHPEALAAALAGDAQAFASLTEPFRRELLTHCYRMLGSLEDAEDQVQETLLRAWRRLETYQGRASLRAWLYKIATNACLDALARRPKRSLPEQLSGPSDPSLPPGLPLLDPVWIEPYPDELLAPESAGPEARYEAAEIAGALDITVSAVNSLLHRARKIMKQRYSQQKSGRIDLEDVSLTQVLERYLNAWESADIDGIVAMLTEEATFPMPPLPAWYQGRAAIRAFIQATSLAGQAAGRWRLLPIHANGQTGFAFYLRDEASGVYSPFALQVLRFEGELISDVTTFGMPGLFSAFGLPKEIG